jgi:hypothetical protein
MYSYLTHFFWLTGHANFCQMGIPYKMRTESEAQTCENVATELHHSNNGTTACCSQSQSKQQFR